MDQNLLHQRRVFPNPLGILSNIIEYIFLRIFKVGFILSDEDYDILAELITSTSNKAGIAPCVHYLETANVHVLAITYPPEYYHTKLYISNEEPNGSDISWYRL